MAKKATLVCRPCGGAVTVSDLGAAVVECWECGVEMVEGEPAKKALPARRTAKKTAKKAAVKKPAARKAAPKRKKK